MSYLSAQLDERAKLAAAVVVALLTMAGCSSDSTEPATESASTVRAVDERLLEVDDFARYIESDDSIVVINVHVPYGGHLPDTDAFIPFDAITGSQELPSDTSAPIALYCRSGAMSETATAALYEAGYSNVVDLAGGMNAWTESGGLLIDDPSAAG